MGTGRRGGRGCAGFASTASRVSASRTARSCPDGQQPDPRRLRHDWGEGVRVDHREQVTGVLLTERFGRNRGIRIVDSPSSYLLLIYEDALFVLAAHPVFPSGRSLSPPLWRSSPAWSSSRPTTGPSGADRAGTARRPKPTCPARWSPAGENVAWSLPFGGRSTPVVFGNRLYLQTTTTATCRRRRNGSSRSMSTSGKVVWERRVSVYLSDVPQDRAGWASPAVDPATGNIYMFTVAAELLALRARRQAAVGAIAARGVRRDHHARRPHDVADHRGRQGHSEHADSELGPGSGPAGQPVFRVRQADRPDDLGQLAAGAALRHELLDADRGRRQRVAAADRRRHRRRVPRASR